MEETFYKRLKKLCSDMNLSINQLEKHLGYPRNALHNYKYGRTPSGQRLLELAQYFEVTPEFLLNGISGNKRDKRILEQFDELSKEAKLELCLLGRKWMLENKESL